MFSAVARRIDGVVRPRRVAAMPRRLDAVDATAWESTHAFRGRRRSGVGTSDTGRGGKSDYTKVKEGRKGSTDSRRPERLLRAPRLALQVLELLGVARRVARVFRGHRAPLVATMPRIRRDPVAPAGGGRVTRVSFVRNMETPA